MFKLSLQRRLLGVTMLTSLVALLIALARGEEDGLNPSHHPRLDLVQLEGGVVNVPEQVSNLSAPPTDGPGLDRRDR